MSVTQSTVSDWEQEAYPPRACQLPQLAQVLGYSIDELFVAIEDVS